MFDSYRNRLGYHGTSDRDAIRSHRKMIQDATFDLSQSYKEVIINDKKYDARVITDVNDTLKTGSGNMNIEFKDGILFKPGTYVLIENSFGDHEPWLIMDVLDNPLRPKTLIKKCVYNLKWKNAVGDIVSRWIAFDDSYKLYDEIRNYGYKTNLPESTLTVNLPYDKETARLSYSNRFIIDDENAEIPNTYYISNKNSVSLKYGEGGIVKISLSQDQFNFKTDNKELRIADYYNSKDTSFVDTGKEFGVYTAKISYRGQCRIVMGTPYKEFTLTFYDKSGKEMKDIEGKWEIMILPELENFFTYEIDGNKIRIKSEYNENILNYTFKIKGGSPDGGIVTDVSVKVVSGI